jgi:hypothetical protein
MKNFKITLFILSFLVLGINGIQAQGKITKSNGNSSNLIKDSTLIDTLKIDNPKHGHDEKKKDEKIETVNGVRSVKNENIETNKRIKSYINELNYERLIIEDNSYEKLYKDVLDNLSSIEKYKDEVNDIKNKKEPFKTYHTLFLVFTRANLALNQTEAKFVPLAGEYLIECCENDPLTPAVVGLIEIIKSFNLNEVEYNSEIWKDFEDKAKERGFSKDVIMENFYKRLLDEFRIDLDEGR